METIIQIAGAAILLSLALSVMAATAWLFIIISRDIKRRVR